MKAGGFDWGNLVHWARLDLDLPLDEEYFILDEKARKMLAQIAKTGTIDQPLMELVAAYGPQMRRIFAARVKDAGEMEEAENEFWTTVVQNAGKHGGMSPVSHWLAAIAKRQAISAYRRMRRRTKWEVSRMPTEAESRNAWEYADELMLTPDEVLEQEELAREARRVVTSFLGSLDAETAESIIRNKVDGITFEAWAKRTGKSVELLRMRVSRAYRQMRKRVPLDLRRALVHVYRGGDLEYAKKQSKKPK